MLMRNNDHGSSEIGGLPKSFADNRSPAPTERFKVQKQTSKTK